VPFPTYDSILIVPFIAEIRSLLMLRPNPTPEVPMRPFSVEL